MVKMIRVTVEVMFLCDLLRAFAKYAVLSRDDVVRQNLALKAQV